MAVKIIKFGIITENKTGDLVFQNFHIDVDHECDTAGEAILQLIIQRLENELKQFKALKVQS